MRVRCLFVNQAAGRTTADVVPDIIMLSSAWLRRCSCAARVWAFGDLPGRTRCSKKSSVKTMVLQIVSKRFQVAAGVRGPGVRSQVVVVLDHVWPHQELGISAVCDCEGGVTRENLYILRCIYEKHACFAMTGHCGCSQTSMPT